MVFYPLKPLHWKAYLFALEGFNCKPWLGQVYHLFCSSCSIWQFFPIYFPIIPVISIFVMISLLSIYFVCVTVSGLADSEYWLLKFYDLIDWDFTALFAGCSVLFTEKNKVSWVLRRLFLMFFYLTGFLLFHPWYSWRMVMSVLPEGSPLKVASSFVYFEPDV